MHPNLATHLHDDSCNVLIEALQKCHVENPYQKFFGVCNAAERAMSKCLKQERQRKREINRLKGKSIENKQS